MKRKEAVVTLRKLLPTIGDKRVHRPENAPYTHSVQASACEVEVME